MKRQSGIVAIAALFSAATVRAEDCAKTYDSTWELIQDSIFEKHGCTSSICHGAGAAGGGLDLRPEVAYQNLVDVPSVTVPGMRRIFPGEKTRSLFFVNMAAKTLPDDYDAPLRGMPLDPVPPLTEEALDLVRLWIESGAPEHGIVRGTDAFNPCVPAPEPIPIKPLPPPPPGEGIQLKMPRWTLPPNSETETCFASWYDFTGQVPSEFLTSDGNGFRFKEINVRQDNLSHHLIVNLYQGPTPPTSPLWGDFFCHGGERDGQTCDPLNVTECGEGICGTAAETSIACIGFGPGDGSVGLQTAPFTGTQETAMTYEYPEGVYREMPLKGLILWNSHAFNLGSESGKLEAWINFTFAKPEEQTSPVTDIFNADELFKMSVPPFGTDEPCHVEVLPGNARLFELSSHMHKRGKRWRTFEGAFRCEGGRNRGEPCSPVGYDMASVNPCGEARCVSVVKKRVSDCNADGAVTVDEVISAVNMALGSAAYEACREADGNGDRSITVDEVITGVNAALTGVPAPTERDPQESLLYVSTIYNDPIILRFDPPMAMPGPAAPDDERALTFCALYDNGYTDPNEVKRASMSPDPPLNFPGVGGPCSMEQAVCATGKVGQSCTGRTAAARDRSCDSAPDAGDGQCDACPLRGGVTTEDEMLLLLGQYYVP